MALVVNTNIASLVAQKNLGASQSKLDTAMERLSSGSRINSASDDAAGLAIASRMESQVRGLNQAVRNSNDGISLAQTAEGAMEEITAMLQRMRELSVQASSGINTADDLSAIDSEITALKAEIDRVSSTTTFNGITLLDGSFSKNIQVGDLAGQSINIGLKNLGTNTLGKQGGVTNAQAVTSSRFTGTAATATKSTMTFESNDTYNFALTLGGLKTTSPIRTRSMSQVTWRQVQRRVSWTRSTLRCATSLLSVRLRLTHSRVPRLLAQRLTQSVRHTTARPSRSRT